LFSPAFLLLWRCVLQSGIAHQRHDFPCVISRPTIEASSFEGLE
jgi:hypothetical protein